MALIDGIHTSGNDIKITYDEGSGFRPQLEAIEELFEKKGIVSLTLGKSNWAIKKGPEGYLKVYDKNTGTIARNLNGSEVTVQKAILTEFGQDNANSDANVGAEFLSQLKKLPAAKLADQKLDIKFLHNEAEKEQGFMLRANRPEIIARVIRKYINKTDGTVMVNNSGSVTIISNNNIPLPSPAANKPKPAPAAPALTEKTAWQQLGSTEPDKRFDALQHLLKYKSLLSDPAKKNLLVHAFEKESQACQAEKNEAKKHALSQVIGVFMDIFEKHNVKEAVPGLIKGLNDPDIGLMCTRVIGKIGDASAIPALQARFSQTPSRIIAVALLKLGEPGAYRDHYLKEDLKILDEPDNRLIYPNVTERQMALGSPEKGCSPFAPLPVPPDPSNPPVGAGLPYWAVLSKCSYTQISVPTAASEMKPEIKENINLLIDKLAEKHDGQKLIPLLLTLLYHPKQPIDKPTIAAAFQRVVAKSDIPLLLEQLKKFPYPDTLSLIVPFLKEQIIQYKKDLIRIEIAIRSGDPIPDVNLPPETHQAVVEAFKGLLDKRELRPSALDFLVEIKERSIIEELKRTIRTTGYCAAEVEALAGLRNHPAEFEDTFDKVLTDEKYKTTTEDARFYSAIALSQSLAGRKDAAAARMVGHLSGFLTGKLADRAASPKETLMLLESFKDLQEPAYIPNVLARLRQSQATLAALPANCPPQLLQTKKENQVIRFFALLTIAGLATKDNTEALKIIDGEIAYWQVYLSEVEREHNAATAAPEQDQFALQVKSFIILVDKIKTEEAAKNKADQPAKP
ncbi:MAG: hypothetical protein PHG97_06480 [Candidatus Margulisbacteria bacterium]|nr:hypothetical protein [Candidatus Margulisiibacteriota bacterium]